MSKKKKRVIDTSGGMVYSTNSEIDLSEETHEEETLPTDQQTLHVLIDKKLRGGKEVTLIQNFIGNDDDLKDLGKTLKSKCGVGGSAKDGVIIVQGNHRDKIMTLLNGMGFKTKRVGG
jgi:translation initiation factor 1